MNINLHNYEAYFLDYHEGSLSLDLVKELMGFMELHPELKEEFESFESITLADITPLPYDKKASLKKQQKGIDTSNFDRYAIEYLEGTLPSALQQELKAFIAKNPIYQKELELYSKTKISTDTSIVFADKASLKRGKKRPAVFYYWSAAASVAFIVGMYFILNQSKKPNGNILVSAGAKDSNNVANHTIKPVDTTSVIPKISHPILTNNTQNNTSVVVKNKQAKRNENRIATQSKTNKDSSNVAVNKATNKEYGSSVKKQMPVPNQYHSGGDSVAVNENAPDTTVGQPLIVINTPHPTTVPKKKNGKFLFSIAKATCKGLHDVTGENIQMEEKYASDTTSIVAYQLDLGKKEFQFPVKE